MNKKYLLDTHAMIWFFEGNETLPGKVKNVITDPENDILVSIATLWEIAVKISIGKIALSKTLADIIKKLAEDSINILPVETMAILQLLAMPFHHKDPFDGILIAQSITENLIIISNERLFDNYGVIRIW